MKTQGVKDNNGLCLPNDIHQVIYVIPRDAANELNTCVHALEALCNRGYINKQYDKFIDGKKVGFCYLKKDIDKLNGLNISALLGFLSYDEYRDNRKEWEKRLE